jgi:hypothetical protein
MVGFLIESNLDVYYYLAAIQLGEVIPIVKEDSINDFEKSLLPKFDDIDIRVLDIAKRVDDNHILFKGKKLSLNKYGSHPFESVSVGYLVNRAPSLSNKVVNYDYLKSILNREGTLYLSEYVDINEVGYYRISKPKYCNEILIDSNPFEFLLIQLGLGRIDEVEFESDELNKESNAECWKRYQNERTIVYEYDFLSRRWR